MGFLGIRMLADTGIDLIVEKDPAALIGLHEKRKPRTSTVIRLPPNYRTGLQQFINTTYLKPANQYLVPNG